MGLLFKGIILLGLARILLHTGKPFVVAGIYSFIHFLLSILFAIEPNIIGALLGSGIAFGLASLYYWLLWRFEGTGGPYWFIFFGGMLIGLV